MTLVPVPSSEIFLKGSLPLLMSEQIVVQDIFLLLKSNLDGFFSKGPGLDKISFKRQRKKLNWRLAKHFKKSFIKFPDVKFPKDFLRDLIHLSDSFDRRQTSDMKKCTMYVQSSTNY